MHVMHGFSFESLIKLSSRRAEQIFQVGCRLTPSAKRMNGARPAPSGTFPAWRHPTYGEAFG